MEVVGNDTLVEGSRRALAGDDQRGNLSERAGIARHSGVRRARSGILSEV